MNKIRNRLLLSFILVSLIPLIVLGGYGVTSISKSLESASIGKLNDKVSLISFEIEDFLKSVANDLFYLRDSVTLSNVAENIDRNSVFSTSTAIENLEKDFLAFSKHKKIYHQVRFLNAEGMEVVRVDRNVGKSVIVSEDRLQNKKKRYYFADTAKLAAGKMMISPLDLNRERGEVERPLRPVIRYGTPVYDHNDKLQGIVLFNVMAENFLELVYRENTSSEQIFFIDNNGFYYSNPASDKVWGGPSDLDSGHTFKKDYPELGSQIVGSKSASIVSQGEHIIAATPVFLGKDKSKMIGSIVDVAQTKEVLKSVTTFRNIFVLIGVIVFLATLFLAIGLAKSITKPLVYLTEATLDMSKGKLDSPISVNTKDETKLLAESIERLRKSMIILLKRKKKQ
ncbi:MAG TPA: HAMP domain-containing protein [Desulfobacterales bacterium]|nr:HAMP domain-containing protein [Desulfobacterales bacterium]HIP40753.1 HAMP domain-containing protein [Desulfocapsa sulfexigens]